MRTKDKWSGTFAGAPELVARHVEFPVEIYDDPGRPMVVTFPLSKIPTLIRSLIRLYVRGTGTRARMEDLEAELASLPSFPAGDGRTGPDVA